MNIRNVSSELTLISVYSVRMCMYACIVCVCVWVCVCVCVCVCVTEYHDCVRPPLHYPSPPTPPLTPSISYPGIGSNVNGQ